MPQPFSVSPCPLSLAFSVASVSVICALVGGVEVGVEFLKLSRSLASKVDSVVPVGGSWTGLLSTGAAGPILEVPGKA